MELSELYSYSEEPELRLGPEKLTRFVGASAWRSGNEIAIVRRLLEAAESANEDIRSDAVSALLYISQVLATIKNLINVFRYTLILLIHY